MSLHPDTTDLIARARSDLRMGVPVVLRSGTAGAVLAAAETLTAPRLAAMQGLSPDTALVITKRRAETLKARAYDGDIARIALGGAADLGWVRAVSEPSGDLETPMKGPFTSQREGRADLHRLALRLNKDARLLPAALVSPVEDAAAVAEANALTLLDADDVARGAESDIHLDLIVSARVPLSLAPQARLYVFRPRDGAEEHYVVEVGAPDRDAPVLARLHSACFTGDLLGSLKCDCGPQLRGALAQMGAEQHGILLYLNQEGRGIGLANKMRAYSLQDQGFDTVEANHRLGFEDDERDFRIGAALLREMGFGAVRLMTNNPAKIAMMERMGIDVVERVPLKVGQTSENAAYLATKALKSGHLL
ncbi:GTP cyclohydrolase II [Poseidonocella sedimentorum]|uniref:GTP cyclohydrolase-2 n=1 Tax=Poseidonocella sedimentorum TaxID=871652 RepID=A0A1I6EQY4_9RHOB|nr:GTP cyclohydrolase II [Poseidonocella sedimentorum]SFR20169.1 GTP cyclohydrolase II [Poseidonocella sedimentorum]